MDVKEVMTSKDRLIVLEPTVTLMEAADRMVLEQVGSVIVADNGMPVGIVTEKDIVRVAQQNKDLNAITLGEIMSFPVITISKDQSVEKAAEMMYRNRIHHLVVIDEKTGVLEGILSSFDLLKIFYEEC